MQKSQICVGFEHEYSILGQNLFGFRIRNICRHFVGLGSSIHISYIDICLLTENLLLCLILKFFPYRCLGRPRSQSHLYYSAKTIQATRVRQLSLGQDGKKRRHQKTRVEKIVNNTYLFYRSNILPRKINLYVQ